MTDIISGDPERMKWDNIKITAKNGEEKFIKAINIPLFEQDMMISTAQDNTEHYVTMKELEQSEKKFRQSIIEAPNPTMIHTDDGEIILVNKVWTEITGYSHEEIPTLFKWALKAYKVNSQTALLDMAALARIDSRINVGEYELTTKSGEKRWWDFSAVPIGALPDGRRAIMDMAVDVTDRKNAEEQRRQLEAQLHQSQKMESIGTLASGIAHDFNNILFPITGYTEMVLEDLPADSPFCHNLNQILKSAKRARDLVKQILAFSRQSEKEAKPVDVRGIIQEVIRLTRSSIPSTIEVNHHLSNERCMVMADPTQIHQIAMNLITNAYHAMETAGGQLDIHLKRQELKTQDITGKDMSPGTYVTLSISDTGIGMEKAVMDKIFDPYFTTKEKGKGTGLGLAVVHGIVKGYKGDITVKSEPGKGTTVSVSFPMLEPITDQQGPGDKFVIKKGTERILLVDDEDAVLQIEKKILESLGYRVTEKTTGMEALTVFEESPFDFDLVITDMTMPKMTGIQLSMKLKEVRKDIPVIICTGFSEQIDRGKAAALGLQGFIAKPVLINEISETVRKVLDDNE